mgnify:CR=1 FL=1
MDDITARFLQIVDSYSKKPYDMLDTSKTMFDKVFGDFESAIHDLEVQLQGFVNTSFETIPNTHYFSCFVLYFSRASKSSLIESYRPLSLL